MKTVIINGKLVNGTIIIINSEYKGEEFILFKLRNILDSLKIPYNSKIEKENELIKVELMFNKTELIDIFLKLIKIGIITKNEVLK